MKRLEEERLRLEGLKEMKNCRKESLSSNNSGDDSDLLENLGDPVKTFQTIQERLKDPLKTKFMLNKLQRNEDLKNLLLQRSNNEYTQMKNCETALDQFLSPNKFPGFFSTRLGTAAFSPDVLINSEDTHISTAQPKNRLSLTNFSRLDRNRKNENLNTLKSLESRGIFELFQKYKYENLSMAQIYAKFFEELDSKNFEPNEIFLFLQSQLQLADKVNKERQKELKELYNTHTDFLQKWREMLKRANKKAQESEVNKLQHNSQETKKKYKVNVNLLKKKDFNKKLEMMRKKQLEIASKKRTYFN